MQCQIKLELQRLDGALSASFLTLNLAIFYIIAWQAWFKEQNNSVSSFRKVDLCLLSNESNLYGKKVLISQEKCL